MIRIKNKFPEIKGLDAELQSITKQLQETDKKLVNFNLDGTETSVSGDVTTSPGLSKGLKLDVSEKVSTADGKSRAELSLSGISLLKGQVYSGIVYKQTYRYNETLIKWEWSGWENIKVFDFREDDFNLATKNIVVKVESGINKRLEGDTTFGDVDSGSNRAVYHRFGIGFTDLDNQLIDIDRSDVFTNGSFGSLLGIAGQNYVEFTRNSGLDIPDGLYEGRKVELYDAMNNRLLPNNDYYLVTNLAGVYTIYLGSNLITNAVKLKISKDKFIYNLGSYDNGIFGIKFNGIGDFLEIPSVLNLKYKNRSDIFSDSDNAQDWTDLGQVELVFDNMWNHAEATLDNANGDTVTITQEQFRKNQSYVIIMQVLDVTVVGGTQSIHPTSNDSEWFVVDYLEDLHVDISDKPTYSVVVGNLPVDKKVGFFVGCVMDSMPSSSIVKGFKKVNGELRFGKVVV